MTSITDALFFALSFVGIPYRWHRDDDPISGDDKFFSKNAPPPTAKDLCSMNLCIVCTGLINLMRRYMKLSVPGVDGSLGDEGKRWAGTTGIWFEYLHSKGRLEVLDLTKKYPKGTLLLRNFGDVKNDQGHVAVLLTDESDCILNENIIHAYADVGYDESIEKGITDVGITGISRFTVSHYCIPTGYYTHVCLPENWLLTD
jgi:hypothetical protein